MKKVSKRLWTYAIGFLLRAILFNFALAFAIVALVYVNDGLTKWAIIAISFSGAWVLYNIINHLTWSGMSKTERALYFGIRRHGPNVVEVTEKEINRRTGQQDILEVLRDTEASLEVQMIVNGSFTLINVFIGIKWIVYARQFNKNNSVFKYEVTKADK